MSRQLLRPIRIQQTSIVLCVICFAVAGCSDDAANLGSIVGNSDPLIIELEKVKYLRTAARTRMDSASGGLAALGDIDGDECTDFVIAASAQGRMAAVDRGWIEAYSGKDGTRLWQVSGKSTEDAKSEGDKSGYHLAEISLLDDLNADGTPDIYCRRGPSGSMALLFSGRDGKRVGLYEVARTGYLQWPLFCRDMNDDGVLDLVFPAKDDESVGIQALSGTDLSPVHERFDIWPEANARWTDWVLPRFSDVDEDGVADCLLRRGLVQNSTDPVYTFEYAVLSHSDLAIISTFESERPRISGTTRYAAAGDLDGDRVEDILMTSSTGDGADNHASSLRAISGADGTILWRVLGTQLKGGRTTQLVDVKTGKNTQLQPDVEFKERVLSIPDIDGDAVNDVATLAFAPGRRRSQRAVLLFSGANGEPFEPLQLSESDGRILQSIALLNSATEDNVPSIAVSVKTADDRVAIVVLPLPQLSTTR